MTARRRDPNDRALETIAGLVVVLAGFAVILIVVYALCATYA